MYRECEPPSKYLGVENNYQLASIFGDLAHSIVGEHYRQHRGNVKFFSEGKRGLFGY